MAEIVKSELWEKFVAEVARGAPASQFQVAERVDEGDWNDFRKLVSSESGAQRDAALMMLFLRCVRRHPPGRSEADQRLCPALRAIVVESYPLGKPAQQAIKLWQHIEPEEAATFVNEWVDRNGITEAVAQRVTLDLSSGNKESFARLRRFAESNPGATLAGNAQLVLERTAPDWKEKLKAYGREWREKRDCRTLLHLTNQLVARMPREDAYIAELMEVMGEPDSVVDRCYTYFTKEEFHGWLYLETDKQGKVTGWKLENC
jgi:hypothetical protein